MGRCYEFGVVIAEGCDHVMVVPAEGGKCVCSGCGTECLGRFNGCASIISQPGYVPILAPEWARTGAPGARTPGAPSAPREPQPIRLDDAADQQQPDHAETGLVPVADELPAIDEDKLRLLLDAPEHILARLESLNGALTERDVELGDAFERFTEVLHRVSAELSADRKTLEKLLAAVERLETRVEGVETAVSRPMIKLRRTP